MRLKGFLIPPPPPPTFFYEASGGFVFGGAADTVVNNAYIPTGGVVFGGAADVTPHVAQVYFDILNAASQPLVVFFDIFSTLPLLDKATAEFDVFSGVPGVTASFDIYSERLRTARVSEDVQMPVAKWELN